MNFPKFHLKFTPEPGSIYLGYTGGFIGFVLLLGLLEYWGLSEAWIGRAFILFTIGIYGFIGIAASTHKLSEYYVAGRKISPVYNGMATGADWMSAASFLALAGGIYLEGYPYLAFVVGWTGGYVLVGVLVAPYLRKFGAYTVPDFLGARYGGNLARGIGVIILITCSFSYILGQLSGTAEIASRFLGIPFPIAVFVGTAGILFCSMLGGMRAVTWTQVAQFIVLLIAYLVPALILSWQKTGLPFPELTYGQALQQISQLEQDKSLFSGVKPFVGSLGNLTESVNFYALIFCLMIGTASLPHVLMRFFTARSVSDTRRSVSWAILFIFLLYFTAPAYAAFTKLVVYQTVIGHDISSLASVESLPQWIFNYGKLDRVQICGVAASQASIIFEACQAKGITLLTASQLAISVDVIVIATPEIANMPYVISALVAAGGLAAALSTADGLLLSIANALSHDIYYHMIDPNASTMKRLTISRVLLVIVALVAALLVSTGKMGNILTLVAHAFSLAAAGFFPALVLGVWWSRTTKQGAIAGMLVGFGVTLFYIIWTHPFVVGEALANEHLWFGVRNISAAVFGLPLGFITTILISLATPPPSETMQDFIRNLRIPSGPPMRDDA